MKRLKQISCCLLICALAFGLLPAHAAQLGNVTTTDIVTFINNRPIRSYNIESRTAIIAEDLAGYGFDVVWDADARTLSVSLNSAKPLNPQKRVMRPDSATNGVPAMPYLETDIKTYVNGALVTGYNIDGQTVIPARELAAFGTVDYDDSTRNVIITIDSIPMGTKTEPLAAYPWYSDAPKMENAGVEPYLQSYSENGKQIYIYGGDSVSMEQISSYFTILSECGFQLITDTPETDNNLYFQKGNLMLAINPFNANLYVTLYYV